MDKTGMRKVDWSWLPAAMPGVAAMVREKRRELGDAHVDRCWRRGVIEGIPGWFFAREGAIAVGTPNAMCDELDAVARQAGHQRAPMLLLHDREGADGEN